MAAPLPLSRPDITDHERQAVQDVLSSTRLALGPQMEAFEDAMAARCNTRHAVAVSSGTAALHCIIRALDLGPGDTVVTTPYSFVASANVLLFEGITPTFVDIDPETYNLDANRLEDALTPSTRAVLAVDVFGMPAPWQELTNLAQTHDLRLIDDACEALGATVDEQPIGSWGDAASFGFYPNKQITTGEGGCITTNDGDLAEICRSLRNQGRADAAHMRHVRLGYNYRLDELSAALGRAQLDRYDDIFASRRAVADAYDSALASLTDALHLPARPSRDAVVRSWFVYVVRLHDRFASDARDRLLDLLQAQGIGCAPYFPTIHLQPLYRTRFGYAPGDFPACEHVAARTLALPFFSGMTESDVARVADALRETLGLL